MSFAFNPVFRRAVVVASIAAAIPLAASAQQAGGSSGRPLSIDDALNIRSSRIEDVSPDGRWIALSVRVRRDALTVDNARYGDPTYVAPSLAEFQLIDATNGKATAILPGKLQVRGTAFNKDGNTIVFFVQGADNATLNVYDIATAKLRAVKLKTTKSVASNSPLVWAPDGKSVIVTLRPDGWAAASRAAFVNLDEGPITVQDSKEPFLSWDRVRNMTDQQIPAVVSIADGSVRELLGVTRISGGGGRGAGAGIEFTPDGSHIVYATADPKKTTYDNNGGSDFALFKLALAAGAKPDTLVKPTERRVAARWNKAMTAFAYDDRGNIMLRTLGQDSAVNLTAKYRRPSPAAARGEMANRPASPSDTSNRPSFNIVDWRPDGSALLVSGRDGWYTLDLKSDSLQIVYPFEADTATRPTRAYVAFSEDGRSVYLTRSARDKWARGLEKYDLTTKQATALAQDANLYSGWRVSKDGARITFEKSDGEHPPELFTAGADLTNARALTQFNPQLAGVALAKTELIHYMDADGKRLNGVLYYPYNYQPGKKYPLVAEIYENYFDNGYIEQMDLLAARGYFVLHPSVSFETGYPGESWEKGVLSAINMLIERGNVDEKQLGVFGTSYGGYATNLLIAKTNRFAAAVNISGKVNMISFLGDSPKIGTRNYNAAEKGQDRIGATLWEAPMKYIQHSAIMFADRIHTPLLMLTGKQDYNVPDTNEREMYYALRRLGREAVWVQYAAAGHGAGRAGTEADYRDHWSRMCSWFGDHFEKQGKGAMQ
jgi:dipeptidyl aminopeptidase/acylaminoacyl peptidase